jgi:hypothetical protein
MSFFYKSDLNIILNDLKIMIAEFNIFNNGEFFVNF